MVVTGAINGWSVTEVVGIGVCMLVVLLASIYRRSLARAIVNTNPLYAYPPINPLRELPPDEARARRAHLERMARMGEIGILAATVLVWVFGVLALIDGREGPLLDALL